MPHKDHEHPPGRVAPRVQALEGVRLAMAVQHDVVLDLVYRLDGGDLVVGQDLALEVWRVHVIAGLLALSGRCALLRLLLPVCW